MRVCSILISLIFLTDQIVLASPADPAAHIKSVSDTVLTYEQFKKLSKPAQARYLHYVILTTAEMELAQHPDGAYVEGAKHAKNDLEISFFGQAHADTQLELDFPPEQLQLPLKTVPHQMQLPFDLPPARTVPGLVASDANGIKTLSTAAKLLKWVKPAIRVVAGSAVVEGVAAGAAALASAPLWVPLAVGAVAVGLAAYAFWPKTADAQANGPAKLAAESAQPVPVPATKYPGAKQPCIFGGYRSLYAQRDGGKMICPSPAGAMNCGEAESPAFTFQCKTFAITNPEIKKAACLTLQSNADLKNLTLNCTKTILGALETVGAKLDPAATKQMLQDFADSAKSYDNDFYSAYCANGNSANQNKQFTECFAMTQLMETYKEGVRKGAFPAEKLAQAKQNLESPPAPPAPAGHSAH